MFVSIASYNTCNKCHFSKGGLTLWTVFCWWFRQEKKVDWPGTGCESDLNIVSYAHTWSIVWVSVIFVTWQYCLLDRLVTWQCWSGNFGLGGTESGFESLHVLPFEKVSGVLRSGDLASAWDCADSTVRCWGPAWALCRCGVQKFAGLPL